MEAPSDCFHLSAEGLEPLRRIASRRLVDVAEIAKAQRAQMLHGQASRTHDVHGHTRKLRTLTGILGAEIHHGDPTRAPSLRLRRGVAESDQSIALPILVDRSRRKVATARLIEVHFKEGTV